MDSSDFVFVFYKDNKIKVLGLAECYVKEKDLLKDGWIHTHTLNPKTFIEYLFNNKEIDIESQINDLQFKE